MDARVKPTPIRTLYIDKCLKVSVLVKCYQQLNTDPTSDRSCENAASTGESRDKTLLGVRQGMKILLYIYDTDLLLRRNRKLLRMR